MFEYQVLTSLLPDVPDEPDWLGDPLYSQSLSDDERVRLLLESLPAARDARQFSELDPESLPAGEQVDLLVALEQQSRWLESLQVRVLAAIEQKSASSHIEARITLAPEMIGLAVNLSPGAAQRRLKTAISLVEDLPATMAQLARGRISARHAATLAEASWALPPDRRAALEQRVLPEASEQTVARFKRAVARAALCLDPAGAEQRHQRARAERSVRFLPGADGMCTLPAVLDAADGQAIFTRLTAAATLLPASDRRTMDQKRADLLVDAVLSGIPHEGLPEVAGRRPNIQVIIPADTLLGSDDQPGELSGYGPITAEHARRLAGAADASWRRLLTDPDTGQLLDIGEASYRPSRRLRDFISARDGVCVFPTCNQPGYRCQFEHATPFLRGGRTCRCNGALACRRHNQCKINTGWGYAHNRDGTFTWTTHTGHRYTSRPPRRWPRPDDPAPPAEPPAPSRQQLQDHEDAAYVALIAKTKSELHAAIVGQDGERAARARSMLYLERRDRVRQLAHRADPNEPPF